MSYVKVPLKHAVKIAELERDSLAVRAQEGGPCAPLWRRAGKAADGVVRALKSRDVDGAVEGMYEVAEGWWRAARCRGFRLPRRR